MPPGARTASASPCSASTRRAITTGSPAKKRVRRIDLAVPASSLLIEKSIGAVAHTGGKRFEADSQYNKTLLRWLEAGAPLDAGEPPVVSELQIFPPKAVIEGTGSTQQFLARASYTDGTDRDVTDLAVFLTSNDNSAAINPDGLVTAGARGEAFVMARFETKTIGSQVLVLPKDLQYTPPPITGNYVDQLVGDKLLKLRILPSDICSDEEFIRRVTIDINGKLPTEEEYVAFMADTDAEQAGQSDRPPAGPQGVLRDLGHEVVRMADGQVQPRRQLQVDVPVQQLADRQDRQQRAAGPDGSRVVVRHGRDVQEPGDEFLPDRAGHAEDGGERGRGVHGLPHAMRPVPQPSVRPLDDE